STSGVISDWAKAGAVRAAATAKAVNARRIVKSPGKIAALIIAHDRRTGEDWAAKVADRGGKDSHEVHAVEHGVSVRPKTRPERSCLAFAGTGAREGKFCF